jgi:hypothetical protein
MGVWIWLASLAVAGGEPSVQVADDGTVRVSVDLDVSAAEVRALLASPLDAMRLSPEILSVKSSPDGKCDVIEAETRGLTRPLVLRALRCPTADGWSMRLLETPDFTRYSTHWRVSELRGRAQVVLETQAEPNVPVPGFLVLRNIREAAVNTIKALERALGLD